MDFTKLLDTLQQSLGETLPGILGALAILIIGWIVALIIRAVVRKGLGLLKVNERVAGATGSGMNIEGGAASLVFYLILLIVLVAFFNALKLEQVSGSLQSLIDQVMAYLPKAIAAGALLLVAWILGTVVKTIVSKALAATTLDDKLTTSAGVKPMSESLAQVLFWLVILLFIPAILGALDMQGLLEPVEGMIDRLLAMLPNILAAAAIGLVGWFLARILRDLVKNLLSAAGADKLGEKVGLRGTMGLSGLLGLIVYIFVLVPALIAALNALKIEAISGPATDMLSKLMATIPDIFGAAIILAIAFILSGFIAGIVSSLLGGLGFDTIPERLGLPVTFNADGLTPSKLVGKIIVFFVMLFAVVEAAGKLGFVQIADKIQMIIDFGGSVLLGTVIIAVGFWLSNLAASVIQQASGRKRPVPVAGLARFAILGLVLAMGLRAMGLADDIVTLAFGLTLGAIAVAVALSFGLGGREAAGKQMEHWLGQFRGGAGK